MSDWRAIAAVTATLQNLLQDAVRVVPGAAVTTSRPDKETSQIAGSGLINVFLYQMEPNANLRNAELPVRRQDGGAVRRPQLALDLHFLLSFYGDDAKHIPHLLLGLAVAALHAEPHPNPRFIPRPSGDADESLDVGRSGLVDQAQLLRFIPLSMSPDDLSKLWSIFSFQVPYALSVAYRCSVVLIESELTPQPLLPVREVPRLRAVTLRLPRIDEVVPQVLTADQGPLTLRGEHLSAQHVRVLFSGLPTGVPPTTAGDRALTVELPPELRAGVGTVSVVHGVDLGEPPSVRWLFDSNPAPFVLQPRIVDGPEVAVEASVPIATLTVRPEVAPGQRVELLLNQIQVPEGEAPRQAGFPPVAGDGEGSRLRFAVSGLEPGTYLARVQVDGAPSPLVADLDPASPTFNRYVGPVLEIP